MIPTAAQACFPLRSSGFKNGSVPAVSRSDWWCRDEELYGFLGKRILLSSALGRVPLTRTTTGFSYPLEIADCSDPSNQYAKIRKDLAKMKHDFGATFVRPYGVECREVSVWLNLVRACIELELGLIAQVWWGFQEDVSGAPISAQATDVHGSDSGVPAKSVAQESTSERSMSFSRIRPTLKSLLTSCTRRVSGPNR